MVGLKYHNSLMIMTEKQAKWIHTQEGRVTSFFLTALYRRAAFFFLNGKKKSKKKFSKKQKEGL